MSTMTDADIHVFGAPAMPEGGRDARPRRRIWPWALLLLATLFVASVAAGVLLLGETLDQTLDGLDIRVDGEHVLSLPRGEAAWWAVGAAVLAAMVVLVVVPLTLLLALLVVALVLAGVVLLALVAGALALSPLWVVALLLWLALRSRAAPAASMSPPAEASSRA
ncbi:MAG: hypothetical protein KIT17_25315 [Rubrivivax sp.]|nr:hypothetical protein [Rubrivivax sp.]